MGTLYNCLCSNCGLHGEVSAGQDRGMDVFTMTGYCANCESLIDIVTEICMVIPGLLDETMINKCEKCNSDEIEFWEDGMPCPRCGGKLKKGEYIAEWD